MSVNTEQCFLTFLITQNYSDQSETLPFAKMSLYFDLLTISPILNLGSLSLISLLESIYMLGFHSSSFILIALRYVLLGLLIISSNLSIYTLF